MTRLTTLAIIAGVAGLSGLAAFGLTDAQTPDSQVKMVAIPQPNLVEPQRSFMDRWRYLVQNTGTICETASGRCKVPPQQLYTSCQCGTQVGEIIR